MNEEEYFQQPLIERYALGIKAISRATHNPENTMLVSLTERDLCTLALSLMLSTRIFPEISEVVDELVVKLDEVGRGQERFGLRFDGE